MLMTFGKIQATLLLLLSVLVALAGGVPCQAAAVKNVQKSFASPEVAAKSLFQAVRKNDIREAVAILGPGSRDIISSGDPVADRGDRERIVRLYEEKLVVEGAESGRAVLSLGNEGYPFSIPLVKKGKVWRFDTTAGKEELLNRRIGRNELGVIEVMRAYVDAQREYAATDWEGDGSWEFARKFRSTPGKRDGLYWEVKEGEKESPFGPLVAKAEGEGYGHRKGGDGIPYHGYLFKILKGQGKDAPGGAFDFLVNGRMILGFAMLAYPAQYGSSGIMSFMVNQNGVVYQKDLGEESARIAASLELFNPDPSWKSVQ
jgi:hypothetical protein